jgi:hypothetical protein
MTSPYARKFGFCPVKKVTLFPIYLQITQKIGQNRERLYKEVINEEKDNINSSNFIHSTVYY